MGFMAHIKIEVFMFIINFTLRVFDIAVVLLENNHMSCEDGKQTF